MSERKTLAELEAERAAAVKAGEPPAAVRDRVAEKRAAVAADADAPPNLAEVWARVSRANWRTSEGQTILLCALAGLVIAGVGLYRGDESLLDKGLTFLGFVTGINLVGQKWLKSSLLKWTGKVAQ